MGVGKVIFETPECTAQIGPQRHFVFLIRPTETGLKTKFHEASARKLCKKVQAVSQDERNPLEGKRITIRDPLILCENCMNIGSSRIALECMALLFGTAYFPTMNLHSAHKISGCEGLRRQLRGLTAELKKSSSLEVLMRRRRSGYASKLVKGLRKASQIDCLGNFVLPSGGTHGVRRSAKPAFEQLGIKLGWVGKAVGQEAIGKPNAKT